MENSQTKITPTNYYEWGDEHPGYVTIGAYVNGVWRNMGQIKKCAALTFCLTFHNPYK
jgi:hypothetical protein